jgi:hypothetical protein
VDGTVIQGSAVRGSQTRIDFGFTWLRRSPLKPNDGWGLSLQSTTGSAIVQCALRNGRAACGSGGAISSQWLGSASAGYRGAPKDPLRKS